MSIVENTTFKNGWSYDRHKNVSVQFQEQVTEKGGDTTAEERLVVTSEGKEIELSKVGDAATTAQVEQKLVYEGPFEGTPTYAMKTVVHPGVWACVIQFVLFGCFSVPVVVDDITTQLTTSVVGGNALALAHYMTLTHTSGCFQEKSVPRPWGAVVNCSVYEVSKGGRTWYAIRKQTNKQPADAKNVEEDDVVWVACYDNKSEKVVPDINSVERVCERRPYLEFKRKTDGSFERTFFDEDMFGQCDTVALRRNTIVNVDDPRQFAEIDSNDDSAEANQSTWRLPSYKSLLAAATGRPKNNNDNTCSSFRLQAGQRPSVVHVDSVPCSLLDPYTWWLHTMHQLCCVPPVSIAHTVPIRAEAPEDLVDSFEHFKAPTARHTKQDWEKMVTQHWGDLVVDGEKREKDDAFTVCSGVQFEKDVWQLKKDEKRPPNTLFRGVKFVKQRAPPKGTYRVARVSDDHSKDFKGRFNVHLESQDDSGVLKGNENVQSSQDKSTKLSTWNLWEPDLHVRFSDLKLERLPKATPLNRVPWGSYLHRTASGAVYALTGYAAVLVGYSKDKWSDKSSKMIVSSGSAKQEDCMDVNANARADAFLPFPFLFCMQRFCEQPAHNWDNGMWHRDHCSQIKCFERALTKVTDEDERLPPVAITCECFQWLSCFQHAIDGGAAQDRLISTGVKRNLKERYLFGCRHVSLLATMLLTSTLLGAPIVALAASTAKTKWSPKEGTMTSARETVSMPRVNRYFSAKNMDVLAFWAALSPIVCVLAPLQLQLTQCCIVRTGTLPDSVCFLSKCCNWTVDDSAEHRISPLAFSVITSPATRLCWILVMGASVVVLATTDSRSYTTARVCSNMTKVPCNTSSWFFASYRMLEVTSAIVESVLYLVLPVVLTCCCNTVTLNKIAAVSLCALMGVFQIYVWRGNTQPSAFWPFETFPTRYPIDKANSYCQDRTPFADMDKLAEGNLVLENLSATRTLELMLLVVDTLYQGYDYISSEDKRFKYGLPEALTHFRFARQTVRPTPLRQTIPHVDASYRFSVAVKLHTLESTPFLITAGDHGILSHAGRDRALLRTDNDNAVNVRLRWDVGAYLNQRSGSLSQEELRSAEIWLHTANLTMDLESTNDATGTAWARFEALMGGKEELRRRVADARRTVMDLYDVPSFEASMGMSKGKVQCVPRMLWASDGVRYLAGMMGAMATSMKIAQMCCTKLLSVESNSENDQGEAANKDGFKQIRHDLTFTGGNTSAFRSWIDPEYVDQSRTETRQFKVERGDKPESTVCGLLRLFSCPTTSDLENKLNVLSVLLARASRVKIVEMTATTLCFSNLCACYWSVVMLITFTLGVVNPVPELRMLLGPFFYSNSSHVPYQDRVLGVPTTMLWSTILYVFCAAPVAVGTQFMYAPLVWCANQLLVWGGALVCPKSQMPTWHRCAFCGGNEATCLPIILLLLNVAAYAWLYEAL